MLGYPIRDLDGTFSKMRAIVQRVTSAEVKIEGEVVGACGPGLCVFAAVHRDDDEVCAKKLADRVLGLRIFNDSEGKMNLSLKDTDPIGEVLVISNFTLYGDASKSRRPSFVQSAAYSLGQELFEEFVRALRSSGISISTGQFGADMQVSLVNDGPVTLIVES